MLMPQRPALFESSWSALRLRRGPDQADRLAPAPRERHISNPDSDLNRPVEPRPDPPRRRRGDTHPRRPQLTYDRDADQFHYLWPTQTG